MARIPAILLCAVCLLTTTGSIHSQCGKRQFYGKAGITFSAFGDNAVIRFIELAGTGSYDGTGFHSLGFIPSCLFLPEVITRGLWRMVSDSELPGILKNYSQDSFPLP